MEIHDITKEIIGAAIEVHKTLGPGLLEKPYELCLIHELKLRGLKCESPKTSIHSIQRTCLGRFT